MIELNTRITSKNTALVTMTLSIDQRVRSRLHAQLDDGREAGIFLPRGSLLRGGDQLCSNEGLIVTIMAAAEQVSTVRCDNPTLLTKAAYHLGNRHVPLQIEAQYLRYQHDPVLDDMLRQMGLGVDVEHAAFEPQAGAYQRAAHSHAHTHTHTPA